MKKNMLKNFIFVLTIPFLCLGFMFFGNTASKTVSADIEYLKAAAVWQVLQSDVNSVFNNVTGVTVPELDESGDDYEYIGDNYTGLVGEFFYKLESKRLGIPAATDSLATAGTNPDGSPKSFNPNLYVWKRTWDASQSVFVGDMNTGTATKAHLEKADVLLGSNPSNDEINLPITIRQLQRKYVYSRVEGLVGIFNQIKLNPTGDLEDLNPRYGSIGAEEFDRNGNYDYSERIYNTYLAIQKIEEQVQSALHEGNVLKQTKITTELNDLFQRVVTNKTNGDTANYVFENVRRIFDVNNFKYEEESYETKQEISNIIASVTSQLNTYDNVKDSFISISLKTETEEYSERTRLNMIKDEVNTIVKRWTSLVNYYNQIETFKNGLNALPNVLEVQRTDKAAIQSYIRLIEDFKTANSGLYVPGYGLSPEQMALESYLWNANLRLAQISDNDDEGRRSDLFIIVLSFGGVFIVIFSIYWFVNYKKKKIVGSSDLPEVVTEETKINDHKDDKVLPKKFFDKK